MKTKKISWTEFDYFDSDTFPPQNKPVLVCDTLGNMQVCLFDIIAHDFIISTAGISRRDLKECIASAIYEIFVNKFKPSEDEAFDLSMQLDSILYSEKATEVVYFYEPYAWMPLPNASPKLVFFDIKDQLDYELKIYSIFDKIEPHLRRALDEISNEKNT
jgi:hypothetical protein